MRLISEANTKPLDGLYAFLGRYEELLAESGQEASRELTPELLVRLGEQPPVRSYPSQYPIEWTSEKQRRAYFATDGFGAGIPYKRTGGLAAAWEVLFERTADGFRMIVQNGSRAARFTYGSLAKNPQAAARFQQRFHAITGWQLASPIVHDWMNAVTDLTMVKLGQKIAGLGINIKRRAVTPRLRRR